MKKTASIILPSPRLNDDGSITICLPVPDRACSPNARRGQSKWAAIKKSKVIKRHRFAAYWAMTQALNSVSSTGPIILAPWGITYSLAHYFKTAAFRDDDNADSACKPYRDGIAEALGIDDRNLRKSKISTFGKDALCPRVEITIHPATNTPTH